MGWAVDKRMCAAHRCHVRARPCRPGTQPASWAVHPKLLALRTDFVLCPAGLESLTVGVQFWAGAEDPRAAEADWLARRSVLAADWRAKRRAALKHSGTHRNKRPRR